MVFGRKELQLGERRSLCSANKYCTLEFTVPQVCKSYSPVFSAKFCLNLCQFLLLVFSSTTPKCFWFKRFLLSKTDFFSSSTCLFWSLIQGVTPALPLDRLQQHQECRIWFPQWPCLIHLWLFPLWGLRAPSLRVLATSTPCHSVLSLSGHFLLLRVGGAQWTMATVGAVNGDSTSRLTPPWSRPVVLHFSPSWFSYQDAFWHRCVYPCKASILIFNRCSIAGPVVVSNFHP